jgi:hypothetical protein
MTTIASLSYTHSKKSLKLQHTFFASRCLVAAFNCWLFRSSGLPNSPRPQLPTCDISQLKLPTKVKVMLRPTDSLSVCLDVKPLLGPKTLLLLLSYICCFIDVVLPLGRECGSVVYSPAGLMIVIYCLRFYTFLTWRTKFPYLDPPGTEWSCYTPRHWVPFSSPRTTQPSQNQSQSQSTSPSRFQAPIWDLRPIFLCPWDFLLDICGLLFCSAISD